MLRKQLETYERLSARLHLYIDAKVLRETTTRKITSRDVQTVDKRIGIVRNEDLK